MCMIFKNNYTQQAFKIFHIYTVYSIAHVDFNATAHLHQQLTVIAEFKQKEKQFQHIHTYENML